MWVPKIKVERATADSLDRRTKEKKAIRIRSLVPMPEKEIGIIVMMPAAVTAKAR